MKCKTNLALKRIIVDYNKLNEAILNLLVEKYPDGYNDGDVISFKNAAGEWIECVEVQTEDTLYLVKVSKRLEIAMDTYDSDDDIDNEDQDDDFVDVESDEDISDFEND